MTEGNSQTDGKPTNDNVSAPTVMSSLGAGSHGVQEITSPVVSGGPGAPAQAALPAPDGSAIPLHHHPLRIMNDTPPAQDSAGARDKGVC